jgi:hypothetical protein
VHVLVQFLGAVAVLAAFAFSQVGALDQRGRAYLALNLVGASVVAVDAWLGAEWGFLLLEGVWALVSAWSLTRRS